MYKNGEVIRIEGGQVVFWDRDMGAEFYSGMTLEEFGGVKCLSKIEKDRLGIIEEPKEPKWITVGCWIADNPDRLFSLGLVLMTLGIFYALFV